MQWFWDDIRVESRTATAADCEQEKVGKKALRLEQTAAAAWVKGQGWDCIADYLEGDNLLQVPVQVGGVTMTWTACWRLWGEKFAVTCDLVSKEGRLDLRDMNLLRSALSEMGSAHKACGFVVTLWAPLKLLFLISLFNDQCLPSPLKALNVDRVPHSLAIPHMWSTQRRGSKKRGSRLRGARRALRKGWGEVLRNNNLDWGLYADGFNVWQPSWTRQEAYGNAKQYWERVMRKGKL